MDHHRVWNTVDQLDGRDHLVDNADNADRHDDFRKSRQCHAVKVRRKAMCSKSASLGNRE